MWRQLTPGEQARLLGHSLLGAAVFALAAALAYLAYQLHAVQGQVPAILAQVDRTTQQIEPLVREVEAIRKQVPPILKEVEATRRLVPGIVAEVRAVREQVPPILTEVAATRAALPPLVAQSAQAVKDASGAVRAVEPHIPAIVNEVRETRAALPGMLDRVDRMIDRAGKIGREAGSQAAYGAIGGILTAPFRFIGDLGKGLASSIGLTGRDGFTDADEKLLAENTEAVIKAKQVGAERTWHNPDSGHGGRVRLVSESGSDGRPCMRLEYRITLASGKVPNKEITVCQGADGTWAKAPD
jgi:hypothetical protein